MNMWSSGHARMRRKGSTPRAWAKCSVQSRKPAMRSKAAHTRKAREVQKLL
jgi:hypothetical protein